MNLLEGVVDRSSGAPACRLADGTRVPLAAATHLPSGHEIVCGMRPEHLGLGSSGLPADVSVVEHTGAETHLVFRIGHQRLVGVFRDRPAIAPGERAHLTVQPARVHVFDRKTGWRQ
jgi:multiple sugar transport system ATP-binding protein